MSQRVSSRKKASRANGALGRGRKTEEGRKRSSLNALKHGLLAGTVVLSTESQPRFDLVFEQLANRLLPNDEVEAGLVLEMAASTWRIRRLWQIETQLMDEAMRPVPGQVPLPDSHHPFPRTARAFSKLAAGPELDLLDRYESRLHRIYSRSLRNLLLLRDIERLEDEEPENPDLPNTDLPNPALPNTDLPNPDLPNQARSEQPEPNEPLTPEHSAEEKAEIVAIDEFLRNHEHPAEANQPKNDA